MSYPTAGKQASLAALDFGFEYMFKILMVGNSGVGKTAVLERYCNDTYAPSFVPTVAVNFKVKTLFRWGFKHCAC